MHSLARCLCLKIFYEITVKLSARIAVSYKGSAEGGSASELTDAVVSRIQFLKLLVTGLKSLMSTSAPSCASPIGQLTTWLLASLRVSKQER